MIVQVVGVWSVFLSGLVDLPSDAGELGAVEYYLNSISVPCSIIRRSYADEDLDKNSIGLHGEQCTYHIGVLKEKGA